MPKYRRKPEIVEAVQWHGFEKGPHDLGIILFDPESDVAWLPTHAHEWGFIVNPGDWIITNARHEKRPCGPEEFELTYEPVEGDTNSKCCENSHGGEK